MLSTELFRVVLAKAKKEGKVLILGCPVEVTLEAAFFAYITTLQGFDLIVITIIKLMYYFPFMPQKNPVI